MPKKHEPEKQLMDRVQLTVAPQRVRLMRNDNGTGRRLHSEERFTYGLGPGTHDLIGFVPLIITQEMVGKPVAQFIAVEMKRGDDRLSRKQKAFMNIVNECGGFSFAAETAQEVADELAKQIGWIRGE